MNRPGVGLLLVMLLLGFGGCQTAVDPEEAKRTPATFSVGLLSPERSQEDPTTILRQLRDRPEAAAEEHRLADTAPPATADPAVLANFYRKRSVAADGAGRMRQRINDMRLAVEYSDQVRARGWDRGPFVLDLARAELNDKQLHVAKERLDRFVASSPPPGHIVSAAYFLVLLSTATGELEAAERALSMGLAAWRESSRAAAPAEAAAARTCMMRLAQGKVFNLKGQFDDAIVMYREAAALAPTGMDLAEYSRGQVAAALLRQGKLAEAEIEAREALVGTLRKRGGLTWLAIDLTDLLAQALLEQGRFDEAEVLALELQRTAARIGTGNLSGIHTLMRVYVSQARWDDAIRTHEAMNTRLMRRTTFTNYDTDPDVAIALLMKDRASDAAALLECVVEEDRRQLGPRHSVTALHQALRAIAVAAEGQRDRGLEELREVTPILLDRSLDIDDSSTPRAVADLRHEFVVGRYISLLADPARRDPAAAAEAFRLAEAVRGRSVARAIDASAARNAAAVPELAALVRRSQDERRQAQTLYRQIVNLMSARPEDQNAGQLARLRAQVDALQRDRQALDQHIAMQYPAYAQLMNPTPGTVAQVQRILRADEAMIATLVTPDRTFVWAIPKSGPVAFAVARLGADGVATVVARLRKSLDPNARIVADIPPFEVDVAHDLYLTLLEPVKAGWERARTLVIIPHGTLGQLPFALLPTTRTAPAAETGALFSWYRRVPWLARTHATVVLPSAGALATLRSTASTPGDRRPFIGFGDPYFSNEQARRARRASSDSGPTGLDLRHLKRAAGPGRLADLPPLPDTAEEIRAIATSLHADPQRDVYLGERANERAVMTAALHDYRVIAFATHGLVPGDIPGLTQPALALTAPEVNGIDGDGLLTMEKILGLRLNADWVVLSACSTASGRGAGSEAISGLGQAFFYAGTRALLVTSWPVETTSARALTTDLFRRQAAAPTSTRARALQDAILSLMDGPGYLDRQSGRVIFTYAHPIFWAPFLLVGDGG